MNEKAKKRIDGSTSGKISYQGESRQFNGYTVTDTGKVFRPNGTEVTGSKIGKRGHVVMTLGGKTVYLARLVYCLFNGIQYDYFNGRIRYYGEYDDCSLKNIFAVEKHKRRTTQPKRVINPWEVRTMFCSGLAPDEIARMFDIPDSRVRMICAGFDGCEMDQITRIKGIVGAQK